MHCPSCGHDLRPGARFCDACGHPVGGVAPPERRPHAPAHLAEKILASRGRLEGERKHVTVLFADVKGSMELAERARSATTCTWTTPRSARPWVWRSAWSSSPSPARST